MNDPSTALSGNCSVIRNPVLIWRDERRPEAAPLAEPPPGPFIVTRSEIISRPSGVTVHIWCTREPATPKLKPYHPHGAE